MKKTKRTTRIVEAINNMNKKDVYSMLLFTLYKLKDDPKMSTLSELCYILDGDNVSKFFSYYGGLTITIPTLKEFRLVLKCLEIYLYVNMEGEDFEDVVNYVNDEFTKEEIKETYQKLLDVINNYEFERGQ